MAQIQNTSTIKEIRTAAGLSISEGFPARLNDSVYPVVDVNPKSYRISRPLGSVELSASGASSIYTASSTKATYITAIQVYILKDSTCDTSDGGLGVNLTPASTNVSTPVILIPVFTLTAQETAFVLSLEHAPIQVSPGSVISFSSNTFTAGKFRRYAVVMGYEVEPFESI